MTNQYLTQLSAFVSEFGIDAADAHLQQLSRVARRRGVAVTASKVMTDRASPAIVRERAFAVVCSALASASRSTRWVLADAS